jgi:hypothetical protein
MSTFILLTAAFIILLIILSRIPGVEHLVKPLVGGVTWVFSTFMGGVGGWLLWGIKTTIRSHASLLTHLFTPRMGLDPAERIKAANRKLGLR